MITVPCTPALRNPARVHGQMVRPGYTSGVVLVLPRPREFAENATLTSFFAREVVSQQDSAEWTTHAIRAPMLCCCL